MLKGYCLPLTPEGKASLAEPTTHYYGGTIICVDYRADEEKLRAFLPEGLESLDGRCLAMVNDFICVGEDDKNMAFNNPARTQYKEGLLGIRCSFEGLQGTYYPYLWVTKDWSMIYGWFFGWGKKIGEVWMTRIPKLNPAIKPLGIGSKLKGIVARAGYRLMEATVEIDKKEKPADLPNFGVIFQVRHFPRIGVQIPEIHQLIQVTSKDVRFSDAWSGKATLKLFSSDNEEFEAFEPIEIVRGYYYNMGWEGHTAKVLKDYSIEE